jgi:cysteine dioxygenase
MTRSPIHTLVNELNANLRHGSRGKEVAGLLADYAARERDWREFALFHDECYARNLVSASELFELLVICWQPGQQSPVHDHQGQNCWMAVLDGEVRERLYHLPLAQKGPLVAGRSRVLEAGSVAYIHDDIALHDIGSLDRPGITLHLYSRPIRECRTFDPATGEESLRGLVYHSIEGVLQS